MASPFRCLVDDTASPRTIRLEGDLDERVDLLGRLGKLAVPVMHIDLSGVTRINSAGVHRWVLCLEFLTNGRRVELCRCSSAFVAQALMIPNMIAGARVESVFLDYWCERCEQNETVLVASVADLQTRPQCPRCPSVLEPDTAGSLVEFFFRRTVGP